MAASDRKSRIMEHLARSSGEFIKKNSDSRSPERKQQIMDHIRQTKG